MKILMSKAEEIMVLKKQNLVLEQKLNALAEENADLKRRLTRKGRMKDSPWMTERRERFAMLYNQGKSRSEIILIMQISQKTYDRLKKYVLEYGLIMEKPRKNRKDKSPLSADRTQGQ